MSFTCQIESLVSMSLQVILHDDNDGCIITFFPALNFRSHLSDNLSIHLRREEGKRDIP